MRYSSRCSKPYCVTFPMRRQFIALRIVIRTSFSPVHATNAILLLCRVSRMPAKWAQHSQDTFADNSVIPYIDFAGLTVAPEELEWLKKKCSFLNDDYLEYLSRFRFKPEQVRVEFVPKSDKESELGKIEISATGPWVETILWEVPLMACLSEIYFRTADRDWTYDGQEGELAITGVKFLCDVGQGHHGSGCVYMAGLIIWREFSRRPCYYSQPLQLSSLCLVCRHNNSFRSNNLTRATLYRDLSSWP